MTYRVLYGDPIRTSDLSDCMIATREKVFSVSLSLLFLTQVLVDLLYTYHVIFWEVQLGKQKRRAHGRAKRHVWVWVDPPQTQ